LGATELSTAEDFNRAGKVYVLNGTDYEYTPTGEVQLVLGEDPYTKEIVDTTE
jgi:hypothetical protein